MYNVKKKTAFKRMLALMMTVFTMALVLSFIPLSANAAEVPAAVTSAVVEELPSAISDDGFITMDASAVNAAVITAPKVYKLEDTATAYSDDGAYQNVVNFFIKWFRRIGALIAFVGAVMFALAIKNNDAEQKQAGLMTMVAGFALVAICTAASMFNLFE